MSMQKEKQYDFEVYLLQGPLYLFYPLLSQNLCNQVGKKESFLDTTGDRQNTKTMAIPLESNGGASSSSNARL